jgi:hypothetical protein
MRLHYGFFFIYFLFLFSPITAHHSPIYEHLGESALIIFELALPSSHLPSTHSNITIQASPRSAQKHNQNNKRKSPASERNKPT